MAAIVIMDNLINIRFWLYHFFFFFLWGYTNIEQHHVRGHVSVLIFNRPINEEPAKSLGIKIKYVPRAVV